jgi:hypothetical protein
LVPLSLRGVLRRSNPLFLQLWIALLPAMTAVSSQPPPAEC